MTKKIVFIGAAGSGKSTIAAEIFVALKKKNINAELVTEWIRSEIHRHGPMKSIWEQYRTLQYQRHTEDSVPNNTDWSIIDSGTLTPYFYSCLYCNHSDDRQRLVLQDMYKYLLDDIYLKRYELVFYIPINETYKANPEILTDGTRFQTETEIETLDLHMNLFFTRLHKLSNIVVLDGPLENRTNMAIEYINKIIR